MNFQNQRKEQILRKNRKYLTKTDKKNTQNLSSSIKFMKAIEYINKNFPGKKMPGLDNIPG